MGNDMTWEQKCRISALRAACASSFDEGSEYRVTDEEMTTRILARAEAFRVALLHDGPLDALPEPAGDATIKEVCPGCGSASRLVAKVPPGDQLYCNHKWHQL